MKKAIIFDMDGTLWDSSAAVAKCWTRVVADRYDGIRVITEQDMKRVMGKTMDKLAQALFPDVEQPLRMQILKDCCEAEQAYLQENGALLYDDLEQVLIQLKEQYHLYIVSNCQSGYIEAFLEHYGFGCYFDDLECFGNNQCSKGENIRNVVQRNQIEQAVYVGDIQGDYDASCEAGVSFIHASYGFGTICVDVPKIAALRELPECVKQVLS